MVDARLFQALSDPTRLKILLLLSRSSMNVTSIVNEVDSAQPAVSRHLRVLREASLINHVRKGKEVEYSLNLAQLRDARLYIEALAGGMGRGDGPEVVEIPVPARGAGPGVRSRKSRGESTGRTGAGRPARKKPRKPAAATSSSEYVGERVEQDDMDDFLL